MNITDSGEKLAEKDIAEFEEQFGIRLPDDYKAFMLEHNGGTPEGTWVFDFFEAAIGDVSGSDVRYFEKLYANETMKNDDLKAGYTALLESDQIPDTLMPIADDSCGNIIFLVVKGERYGSVLFGNHELEDPKTGHLITSIVAGSFTEFLEACFEFDLDAYDTKQNSLKRYTDTAQANKAVGLDRTPEGYTWHYLENGQMLLVDEIVHGTKFGFPHTGGFSMNS
ncbi:MAG: SMI1/KNR4 family protein [Coriobacteriales bacterium]|jgi:cell wall assembly regulator SMI1|nr:SMI1/KNR4 family protein [Coriobacteriales bacterium]